MLLSVITINLNNKKGLQETIESVVNQKYRNFEYVIIDGNSNDGSIEVIKQYSNVVNNWISEPDKGIYDAQNKGIKLSQGNYLLFLNSGDKLVDDNILERLAVQMNGVDIVYGDLEIIEPNKRWVKKYSQPLTFGYFLRDTLPHQASFINRDIINKCGGLFDDSLSLASDWKFFLDAVCRKNATVKYVDEVITLYDYLGISSLKENQTKLLDEKKMVLENEYPRFYKESPDIHMLNAINGKYRQVISARFVRLYFYIRNFFSADKITLP